MEEHGIAERFAAEVRAELARQNKTSAWLASEVGIATSTMARRLSGASAFDMAEAFAVAYALGLSFSALVQRSESVNAA